MKNLNKNKTKVMSKTRTDDGMTPRIGPRNPFHVLVGRWLAKQRKLRTRRGSTSEAAQALDLVGASGEAFVRALETGVSPLPADKALAISQFSGISFTRAAELVTLVRHFDVPLRTGAGGARMTNLDELSTRVQQMRPTLLNYGVVLDWLIKWLFEASTQCQIQEKSENLLAEAEANIDALDDALRSSESGQSVSRADTSHEGLDGQLSPLIADILRDLVDRLSLFPPHINFQSWQTWERTNAHRIMNVWGVVSRPTPITAELAQAFDWRFLLNPYQPHFTMIIKPRSDEEIAAWNAELRSAVRASFAMHSEAGEVRKAIEGAMTRLTIKPNELAFAEEGGFIFDFRTRLLMTDDDDELRKFLLKGKFALKFSNVWIYELANTSIYPQLAKGAESRTSSFVGILDDFDYQNPKKQHFFSVPLGTDDLEFWKKLLGVGEPL